MNDKNGNSQDGDENGEHQTNDDVLSTPEAFIPFDQILPPVGKQVAATKIKVNWNRVSGADCVRFLTRMLDNGNPQMKEEDIKKLGIRQIRFVCNDVSQRFNTAVDMGQVQEFKLPAVVGIAVPVGNQQNSDGKIDGDDGNIMNDAAKNEADKENDGGKRKKSRSRHARFEKGSGFNGGGAFRMRNANHSRWGNENGNSRSWGAHPENDLKAVYRYFVAANGCCVFAMDEEHAEKVANVALMTAKSQAARSFMLNVRTVEENGETTYIFCDASGKECRSKQRPNHFDVDDNVDDPGHLHKTFNSDYFKQPPKKKTRWNKQGINYLVCQNLLLLLLRGCVCVRACFDTTNASQFMTA